MSKRLTMISLVILAGCGDAPAGGGEHGLVVEDTTIATPDTAPRVPLPIGGATGQ